MRFQTYRDAMEAYLAELGHFIQANQAWALPVVALISLGESLVLVGLFIPATAVMLLSAVICWIVVKTKLPGRWLLDNLASLPLVFPGLVLGLSFMIVSLKIDTGIS